MSDPEQVIPFERLPERFAQSLDDPDREVAVPRPAATVVVARDGTPGLEVLLLRRNRSAGFVPGAYVFPGGRVDASDADPILVARTDDLTEEQAARRLEIPEGDPSAVAYFLAAVRETFEETGLLIARTPEGEPAPGADDDARVEELRTRLLNQEVAFGAVLEELDVKIDGRSMEYVAHWITPKAEPRRYDTRFFVAKVPGTRRESVYREEITESLWIPPGEALDRNGKGTLPMVFPTLKTLEELTEFASTDEVLEHYGARRIPSILPELVKTPTGVGIRVPESKEE